MLSLDLQCEAVLGEGLLKAGDLGVRPLDGHQLSGAST